jgi:DNA helicase-2/ATP-dependent DNA helicase PcrA
MQANSKQHEAIIHKDGPLLIIAGAGSGKTATLTQRIAYLISQHHVDPSSILALTFTNKAAGEMKERTGRAIGQEYHPHMLRNRHLPYMGTFHSFWIFVLREVLSDHFPLENISERIWLKKDFLIYDESDKVSVMKDIIKNELGLIEKEYPPRQVAYYISDAKNKHISPKDYEREIDSSLKEVVAKVYVRYEKRMQENNALDFDDILLKLLDLLENPEVLEIYQERYKYIMIDEYQDTNMIQYRIVSLLAGKYRNLAVVGDDWQCLHKSTNIQTAEGIKPIEDIQCGDRVMSYDGDEGQKYYSVEGIHKEKKNIPIFTIHTLSGKKITSTWEHIFFANPEYLWTQNIEFGVYLMYKKWYGFRIGFTRFTWRTKSHKKVSWLRKRLNWERADYAWLVYVTHSEKQAKYYEQYLSSKYGIPQSVFYARGKLSQLDQDDIDRLYKNIDTYKRAERLFDELNISWDFPHIYASATNRNDSLRVNINYLMMWWNVNNRRYWMHRCTLHSSHREIISLLETHFPQYCRKSRLGIRIDKELASYEKIWSLIQDLQSCLDSKWFDVQIIRRLSFHGRSLFFTPAKNLRIWFWIPIWNQGSSSYELDEICKIESQESEETVYDIDISRTHNFVANGIVVHNSIYSWRGADMKNILSFKKDYPDAEIIKLEQNYRSTKTIIAAANTLISKNVEALKKELWTENTAWEKISYLICPDDSNESNSIAENIQKYITDTGTQVPVSKYSDNLILYRTNAQSRSIEEALLKKAIPYKVVWGQKFYDRKEIKDILAYLRVIHNPSDSVSLLRIINTPSRKIGAKSLEVISKLKDDFWISFFEVLEQVEVIDELRPAAKLAMRDFYTFMQNAISESAKLSVMHLIEYIIRESWYEEYLRTQFPGDEFESKRENLSELKNVGSDYEGLSPRESLALFLENVSLISDLDGLKTDEKTQEESESQGEREGGPWFVTLMTIHSAKGLEQKRVFVCGLEEWNFPHSRSLQNPKDIEEERRLMYVAMTRAREELYLSRAKMRYYFGEYIRNPESRFITEIPEEYLEKEELWGGFSFDASFWFSNISRWEETIHIARPAKIENTVSDFPPGTRVSHHKFWIGVIDSLVWEIAEIRFRDGVKKMNIRIAPVKKVVE